MKTVDEIKEIKKKYKVITGEDLESLSILSVQFTRHSKTAAAGLEKLSMAIHTVKDVKPSKTNPNDRKYKNKRKW